jgi:uncharacterized membrane protein required for colicin V production
MWWIIDIILAALIITLAVRHCIKGFMHSVYNVAKFLVAGIAAIIFGKPIGAWISDSFMKPKMSGFVYEKISGFVGGNESLAEFFNNIPAGFIKLTNLFGMDIGALKEQYGNAENSEAVLREMSDNFSSPLANTISAIIAYVAVFVVVFLILMLVFFLLEKIKLPLFTGIDKLLGLALGIVLGLLSASLISTAVYSLLEFLAAMNPDSEILNLYNESYVFKFIYNLKIFEFIRNLI